MTRTAPEIRLDLDDDRDRLLAGVRGRRWVRLEGGSLPYPISISVGVGQDGRLACTGLVIGAAEGDTVEVTSASLRSLRLAELLQELVRLTDDEDFGELLGRLIEDLAEDLPSPPVRPGSGGLPDEHFQAVAREYRRALQVAPRAPVQELCRRMGGALGREIPEPTARRWIQRARDRGLLGESTPGKAGERPKQGIASPKED